MKATVKLFTKFKQTKKGNQSIGVKTLFTTTYEPKTDNIEAASNACVTFALNLIGGRKLAGLKGGKSVPSTLYYQIEIGDIVLRNDKSEVHAQWKGLFAVPQSKVKVAAAKGENPVQYVVTQLKNGMTTAAYQIASVPAAKIEADKVIVADEIITSALMVTESEEAFLNETILN